MIGRITNTKVSERLPGSISLAIASIEKGVKFLRVHDIKETKQALTIWNKIIPVNKRLPRANNIPIDLRFSAAMSGKRQLQIPITKRTTPVN